MKLIFLNLELAEVDVEGFPSGSVVKNPPASAGDVGSIPGSGIPWRRKWQPISVLLPGKPLG